jgi:hypothetical protein
VHGSCLLLVLAEVQSEKYPKHMQRIEKLSAQSIRPTVRPIRLSIHNFLSQRASKESFLVEES